MSGMEAKALDHVALWVSERDELARFLCDHLGMHVIERTDDFTLVGAEARGGKLTLFRAEGERKPGVLGRVVLRVSNLDEALAKLPSDLPVERRAERLAHFQAPAGLALGLAASGDGVDYDIDHVVLRVPDPAATFSELTQLGFTPEGDRLAVGDKHVVLERGSVPESDSPLLNHLALLVDSGISRLEEAKRRGLEIDEIRDAPNTYAVFVRGPDDVRLEYVEHKPTFSLV